MNILNKVSHYGISSKDIDSCKNQLRQKFGKEPSDGDVLWRLYNELALRFLKIGDLEQLKTVYFEMALYLNESGKNCTETLQLSNKYDLLNWRKMGYKNVIIVTCGSSSCDNCNKNEGKTYTISEALKLKPLPCKDCTFKLRDDKLPWCRCSYDASDELPVSYEKLPDKDKKEMDKLKNLSPQKKKSLLKACKKFLDDLKK